MDPINTHSKSYVSEVRTPPKDTIGHTDESTFRNPVLETPRLILRSFTENDIPDIFDCCQNPNLGNNAGWKPHDSIQESKEILHTVFMQEGIYAIELIESKRVIGSIGLIDDPKRYNPSTKMIGYWLHETYWNQGLMTEAVTTIIQDGFSRLNLSLISANCYPHNQRSQAILKKQGFIYEGIIHQAEEMYDGRIYDHLCYYLPKP